MKKLVTLILCLLMIGNCFIACKKNSNNPNGGTSSEPNTNEPTSEDGSSASDTDENGYLKDNLPEVDFGKTNFQVFGWKPYNYNEYEVPVEGMRTRVDGAIYQRNRFVENRFGVLLNFKEVSGDYFSQKEYITTLDNSLMAGDSFDMLGIYSMNAITLAVKGYLEDLLSESTSALDFDAPWWSASLLKNGTIGNRLYYASGDIAISCLMSMGALLYNYDVAADHEINNDPIDDVLENNWTLARMLEYTMDIYQDLDHDGKKSEGDMFGYIGRSHVTLDSFSTGADLRYVTTDEDGNLCLGSLFTASGRDRLQRFGETLLNAFYVSNDWACTGVDKMGNFQDPKNALFLHVEIGGLTGGGYDYDYAVLPFPKYDEIQDNYCTNVGFGLTLYSILKQTPNKTKSAIIMEGLASAAYRMVTDVYYESEVKSRYASNDARNAKMFDIIRNTVDISSQRLLWNELENIGANFTGDFRNKIQGNQSDFSSSLEVIEIRLGIYLRDTLTPAFRDQ